MLKRSSAVVALVFTLASAVHAKPATTSSKSSFPNPLTSFGPNLVDAFGVRNLVWHDGAVAATVHIPRQSRLALRAHLHERECGCCPVCLLS